MKITARQLILLAALPFTMSPLFVSQAIAAWITPRATDNQNAELLHQIQCLPGSHVTGFTVAEQSGYGIVDVRFFCSNGLSTRWATNNRHAQRRYFRYVSELKGLVVYEQYNFGIINFSPIALDSLTNTIGEGARLVSNARENRELRIRCDSSRAIGARVYEQHHHGVVDIALICQ